MTLDEKLDNFYKLAMEDAQNQSVEIIDEYKQSLKKIYDSHKMESLSNAESMIQTEKDDCVRERNKILSAKSIEIRKKISKKSKELTDILYADVEKKLMEYRSTPDYTAYLEKLIRESIAFSRGNTMTLYITPADEDKKTLLESKTGVKLTISSTEFLGGIRAIVHEKHILIDNSFSTKLNEGKETFTL